MKKFLTFTFVFLLSFLCMKGTVFAKFEAKLDSNKGKVAVYKVTSSIKYTKVTAEPGAGVSEAKMVWNADGVSGTLTVTYSSSDCIGDVTLVYNADEGCSEKKPENCDAILADARSMIGKIPYEMGGKCSSKDFDACQFGLKYTDRKSYDATRAEINKNGNIRAFSPAYVDNLTRYGDHGKTGLDCSGFVWYVFFRNGYDLVGNKTPLESSAYSGVSNITSGSPIVYSITKAEAQPCDLVTSTKPENGHIPHVGIVSQTDKGGGWLYVHENGSDANVAENCYFDCKAPAQGKAVYYWRVKTLWDGASDDDSSSCTGKEPLHLDNHELCTCETCDEIEIKDDYLAPDSQINNCCVNGDSYLKEYSISQLFCSNKDEDTKVSYYADQCNNDLYEDDAFDGLKSEYCKMYCTEEMKLQTPKEISSATGKFFRLAEFTYKDLSGVDKTTKAPVITGTKTCTVKIAYDKWRKEYERTVGLEIDAYNAMQMNLGYYELTRDPKVEDKELKQDIKVSCTSKSQYEKDGTVGNGATYTDSSGNSKTCDKTSCDNYKKKEKQETVSCTNTYTQYTINTTGKKVSISCDGTDCTLPYYQVKANASFADQKSYNGLTIESAGTTNAKYAQVTVEAKDDNCTKAVKDYIDGQSDWDCSACDTPKSVPDDTTVANMKKAAEDYKEAADQNIKDFKTYTASAQELEKGMTECQTMFHDTKLAAEDPVPHDASNYFKLNPSATFKYLQVYLNNNVKNKEWLPIEYGNAKCTYTFKNTGVKDIDNVDQYWSEDIYKKGSEEFTDMKADDKFITKASEIPLDDKKKIEKKFRQDAQYDAQCNWDDAAVPEEITLYPGPIAKSSTAKSGEIMITQHKYQYALYLTTYVTEYETAWEIKDIGGSERTKDKFIKAFNDAAGTCAQLNTAYSDGEVENNMKDASKQDHISNTCFIQVKDGGMRIGTCQTGVGPIDESCHDNEVREVFEFRIVDPRAIFPSGDWSDKAHNWKNDAGDWGTTKKAIELTASSDKTYAPENLTYAFRLTTNTLKAIKDYNDTTTYDDFNVVDPAESYCPSESEIDESGCGTIDKPVNSNCLITEAGRVKWKYTCRKFKTSFVNELAINNKVGSEKVSQAWNNPNATINDVRDNMNHWA